MPASLLDCPYEIIVDILEYNAIQFAEIRSLRLTHSSFRSIIDPLLFHTFRFSLDDAFDRSLAIASLDPSPIPISHPYSKSELCGRHGRQKFPNLAGVFHLWDGNGKAAKNVFGKKKKPRKAKQRGSYSCWETPGEFGERNKALCNRRYMDLAPWRPNGEHGFIEEDDYQGAALSIHDVDVQMERYKLQARSFAQRATWRYIRNFVKHINIEAITDVYIWPSTEKCGNLKPEMRLNKFLESFPNLKSVSWNIGDTEIMALELAEATRQIVQFATSRNLPTPTLTISASLSKRYIELYYSVTRSTNLCTIDLSLHVARHDPKPSMHGVASMIANAPNLIAVRIELQQDLERWIKYGGEDQFKCSLDMDQVLRTAAGLIEARAAGERESPTLNLTKCEKDLSVKTTRDIKRLKLHNVYLPRSYELMRRFLSGVEDLSYTFTLENDDVWDNIAWNVLNEGYTPPNLESLTFTRLGTQALSFLRSIPDKGQLPNLSKLVIEPARYRYEFPEFNPNGVREQQDEFAKEFWSSVLPALEDTLKEFSVKGSCVSTAWMWTPFSPASAAIEELRSLRMLEICACGTGGGCNAHAVTQAVLCHNSSIEKLVIWYDPDPDMIHATPSKIIPCLVMPNGKDEVIFDLEGFDDASHKGRTSLVVVYQRPKMSLKDKYRMAQYGDIADATAYQLYKATISDESNDESTWQYRPVDIEPSALSYGAFSRQGFVEPQCKAAHRHESVAPSFDPCGCTMGTNPDMSRAVKKYGLRAPYTSEAALSW